MIQKYSSLVYANTQKIRVWVFAEPFESPEQGFFIDFDSMESFQEWSNNEGVFVHTSKPFNPDSERSRERIFYRSGDLPEDWNSFNYREQHAEGGVSAYFTPEANSFAGLSKRPWFYGKGIQVSTGSDGEPVIIPTGKWKKLK